MKSFRHKIVAGFSLIELLVAMTIGLILISGMIAVFSGNKRSSELNNAMANMQENARFALDAMSRDSRMAGFQGCVDVNNSSAAILANQAPSSDLFLTVTTGSKVTSATVWDPLPIPTYNIPQTNARPIVGTHTLTLQFGSQITRPLATSLTTRNSHIEISENPWNIGSNELMIIANCEHADLFRTTNVATTATSITIAHGAAGNSDSGSLTNRYDASDTMVMRFLSNIYYIGTTGLTNEAGDPISSLYRQSLPYSRPPVELVQGVENMRVRFGIRNNKKVLRYVTPSDATFEPGDVESIQIGLLMSSWDRIQQEVDEQTYVLAGIEIPPEASAAVTAPGATHPKDRRYRLAFNTTIKVRNRR